MLLNTYYNAVDIFKKTKDGKFVFPERVDEYLKQHYPETSLTKLAWTAGVWPESIKTRLKKIGIYKPKKYTVPTEEQLKYIIENFADTPRKELAETVGIPFHTLTWLAKKYKLKRNFDRGEVLRKRWQENREEFKKNIVEASYKAIDHERSRIRRGLPIKKLKRVKNGRPGRMATRCRKKHAEKYYGYIVIPYRRVLLYNENTRRDEELERTLEVVYRQKIISENEWQQRNKK